MKNAMFFLLVFFAVALVAHPPKSIELGYDAQTGALSVNVLHKVSDPEKHFIRRIEVRSGKELLAEKNYERQESASGQKEMFLFVDKPLASGTAVTVTAFCNLSGKKSADLEW
ncbi:MAG: hypothetical protein MUF02_04665 [Acidobacteria bacterium]|jgi:desulfoferrodoxin (superoxide reductase-like protein)|nr:hypothetical protein [Acidobacteriota bacterium]